MSDTTELQWVTVTCHTDGCPNDNLPVIRGEAMAYLCAGCNTQTTDVVSGAQQPEDYTSPVNIEVADGTN